MATTERTNKDISSNRGAEQEYSLESYLNEIDPDNYGIFDTETYEGEILESDDINSAELMTSRDILVAFGDLMTENIIQPNDEDLLSYISAFQEGDYHVQYKSRLEAMEEFEEELRADENLRLVEDVTAEYPDTDMRVEPDFFVLTD